MKNQQKDIHDVIKGTIINLLSNLGKLSHLFFDLIATRFMGHEVFGYFSTTWLIMNLTFVVCYFGGHRLIIDFIVRSRANGDDEYYRGIFSYVILSFLLSGLLVAFIYLFAEDIAAYMDKPALAGYLKIMVWSAPFYCVSTVLLTATRGLKIMQLWVYVRNGIEPFVDLVYIAVLFFAFSMVSAPITAKALGFVTGAVFAVYFYRRHFSVRKIWAKRPTLYFWKQILVFGFPVMIMELMSIVTLKVDLIPLSIMASASLVGVYQIILNVGNVMRNIPQSMDPILMPVVVSMRIKNDSTALKNIYVTLFRVNIMLSFGFFILVAIFGDMILMIFGEYFVIGTTACMIACFGIMLNTVFSSIEAALIMYGYPYTNMAVNIFFVAVNLVLDFLLIPLYGLTGAALGSLTACVLTAIVQTVLIRYLLKINPFRWDFLHIIAAGLSFWIFFAGVRFGFFSAGLDHFSVHAVLGLIFLPIYLYYGWKRLLQPGDRAVFSGLFKNKIKEL